MKTDVAEGTLPTTSTGCCRRDHSKPSRLLWFTLGFLTYPLLFVPLLGHYAPDAMNQLIFHYHNYLAWVNNLFGW